MELLIKDLILMSTLTYQFLTNIYDIQLMAMAWEAGKGTYRNFGIKVFPGPLILKAKKISKSCFHIFAKLFVHSYFHWMGSCQVETSLIDKADDWVVDRNFLLCKSENLRVCNASIFQTLVSSPPALTCASMGNILGGILQENTEKKSKKC